MQRFCNCQGFQYKYEKGVYKCYIKALFLNGYQSPGFRGDIYVKLPKAIASVSYNKPVKIFGLDCPDEIYKQLDRTYVKSQEKGFLKFMIWFACAVGVDMICIISVWCFLFRTQQDPSCTAMQVYLLVATRFQKFAYAELQKATQGFREEIGGGGEGLYIKAYCQIIESQQSKNLTKLIKEKLNSSRN